MTFANDNCYRICVYRRMIPNETIDLISSIPKVAMKRLEVKSLMKFLVNYLKGGV